jgi:hypothetical protein
MQKKYDAIQLASIRRSETYLRKKAMQPSTGHIRETLTGIIAGITLAAVVIIFLAL